MTPKISQAQGHHKQLYKNPSILAGAEDFIDDDDWDEVYEEPRRRSSSVEATLSSCFTSLSSGIHSVRFAVTTRAKRLCTRDSTRGSRLRNSMVEISSATRRSLARANSMPAPYHRSSESDLDLFGGVEDELDAENPAEVCVAKLPPPSPRRSSTLGRGRFSKLLPTRSWTLGSK